jgi:uncharacterized damage-inducible protein DinB
MLSSINQLFQRDIAKIQEELRLYEVESSMWKTVDGISNSGGNLALHVAGNLQHFIGAVLGNTGYVRQRELEFSQKDLELRTVYAELEYAKIAVEKTLSQLGETDLQKSFPINVFKKEMTTEWFLFHLLTHTSYHLGQINYHRRMIG